MGLYDEIEVNKPCLKCKKNIETLQTKATSCNMDTYKKGDYVRFDGMRLFNALFEVHGYCNSCGYWHDGEALLKDERLVEVRNLVLGEKIVGFKSK